MTALLHGRGLCNNRALSALSLGLRERNHASDGRRYECAHQRHKMWPDSHFLGRFVELCVIC